MSYLHSLVILLTVLGLVIDALTRRWLLRFLLWRQGAGHKEAADRTESFVGRSAGGGKRTSSTALETRFRERQGQGGCYKRYIELAVRILHPFDVRLDN